MEAAFHPGGFLEKPAVKTIHAKDPSAPVPKREDVDLIVSTSPVYRLPHHSFALFFESIGVESRGTALY